MSAQKGRQHSTPSLQALVLTGIKELQTGSSAACATSKRISNAETLQNIILGYSILAEIAQESGEPHPPPPGVRI